MCPIYNTKSIQPIRMPFGPVVKSISVRCQNEDGSEEHEFPSIDAASKFVVSKGEKPLHHTIIKKKAGSGELYRGYKWTILTPLQTAEPDEAPAPTEPCVFTFRECVESIFNGTNVRVTSEVPRRVSVFDVIGVVTDVKNTREAYNKLVKSWPETVTLSDSYQFPGGRGPPTPVCDASQLMQLVNLLPGRRAMQFRKGAADVLVRYLAGDQSMHEELDDNAYRQAKLPAAHPMKAFSEQAAAMKPTYKAEAFISPNKQGVFLGSFHKKSVVYLLEFKHAGVTYVKVGYSYDIVERMKDHVREYPGCRMYTAFAIDNANLVEKEFKEAYNSHQVPLTLEGKLKTELFTGASMAEWEIRLQALCDDQRSRSEQGARVQKLALMSQCTEALAKAPAANLDHIHTMLSMLSAVLDKI